MRTTFFKAGCRFATLALAVGAVPALVAPASAIELGQHLDHGPKWPHKSITRAIGGVDCPGAACTPQVIDQAVKSGEITPQQAVKLRKIQSNLQANKGGGGNASTLAIVGGVVGIAAIVAASGGSSSP